MRGFLKVALAFSGVAFAFTLVATILALSSMGPDTPSSVAAGGVSPGSKQSMKDAALFHVLAILPTSDSERFYARAREAMERAARKDGAVLQTLPYSLADGPSAVARVLALAAELEPDGVIAAVPSDPAIVAAVNALVDLGVPVVAFEKDVPGSRRKAFVGTNPFSVGVMAAEAVTAAYPRGARVALVLSRDYADGEKRGATLVAGFLQGLRLHPGATLELTRTAREGPAASEEIVRDLLADHGGVNVAVFTGARDAEGAARAIIEYDRVGDLTLIGFDDDPALLEMVDTGVVAASIARSPESTGEAAVEAVMTLARGGRVSAYIDPGLRIIRRGEGKR